MELRTVTESIVNHYVSLVKAGRRDIREVPDHLMEEVADLAGIDLHELTLEEAKENKIKELSAACNAAITTGTDVELAEGTYHFSFSRDDQTNIKNLFDMTIATKMLAAYHADGGEVILYSYDDIARLYVAEQKWIIQNTTHYNMLKQLISQKESIEEVNEMTFTTELTGGCKERFDAIMEQSIAALDKMLENLGINNI